MEISRLSFTKKTQNEMEKDLSVREKGKILFARLQELEEDGTLSKAQTRADVARLAGYPEERAKAGYSWVSNLVRRGHLTEIIREWTPSGRMIAEYHLAGNTPNYGYEEAKRRKAKKKVGQELRRWQDKMTEEELIERMTPITPIKMEIAKGDMTIKVEFAEVEQATNLITTIMKGE